MIDQVVQALRGLISRGVVTGGSDAGETQTVDVQTHEGILRGAIEVLQPFGLASRAPTGSRTSTTTAATTIGTARCSNRIAVPLFHLILARWPALVPLHRAASVR